MEAGLGWMELYQAWFCWIFPLTGAMLTPILAKIHPKVRDYGAVFFSFLGAAMTASLIPKLFDPHQHWPLTSQIDWIVIPGAPIFGEIKAGVLVDPLTIIMANVVAIIAFLIMVYSLGYMHGDRSLTRYWFLMNLFIGNMLLLVMSDNLIQMLFGWEGVGICSYALIGFWYRDSKKDWLKCWTGEEPEAYPPSHDGMKAFIATRIGDVSLLIGAFIILAFAGTLNFLELQEGAIHHVPIWALVPAAILLFGGPVGKSAQLPLLEWLPDAMAGPTTVSALIHAATMVKAGVYLMGRMFPVFYTATWHGGTPTELVTFFYVVAWIGALTVFLTGAQGMASVELKKVLAYSTLSQLGYMMLALGVAGTTTEFIVGYTGGVFHLMSHAMFKAALFLAAGAVLHTAESRFLRDMGGLKKHMPITFWSMTLASFSLMGVPIVFSGYWSKDTVLEAPLLAGEYGIFALGVVSVAITCFYAVRMLGKTFLGEKSEHLEEMEKEGHHLHESPPVMWVPYVLLVAGTIGVGLIGSQTKHWIEETFHHYLGHTIHVAEEVHGAITHAQAAVIVPVTSLIMLAIGVVPAYLLYVKRSRDPAKVIGKGTLKSIWSFLYNRMYLNRFYYNYMIYPTIRGSQRLLKGLELGKIDRFNYVLADKVVGATSWMLTKIELNIIDRFNYALANATASASRWTLRAIELAGIDKFNYVLANAVVKACQWTLEKIELGGIDKFNYVLASAARAFCNRFRRTHTGVLNYSIAAMIFGIFMLLLLTIVMVGW